MRHEHSQERVTDGATHWKFTSPKFKFKFRSDGGSKFTNRDWINFIWKGSNNTRLQYCQNSCNKLLYIRAIHGHRRRTDSTRGGREGRVTRHTVFFTPLNPWRTEEEEEYCRDLAKPRKVHHKTGWKHCHNAVYWIRLGDAQEKGMAFWRTKSHAIITNSTVPPDCVERVISQHVCQRSSTPRLAPRTVLKMLGMSSSSRFFFFF